MVVGEGIHGCGGVCMVAGGGGMHGWWGGVLVGGHVWLWGEGHTWLWGCMWLGDLCGCRGTCIVVEGCICGSGGGHAWHMIR